jgi:hypothetical protein
MAASQELRVDTYMAQRAVPRHRFEPSQLISLGALGRAGSNSPPPSIVSYFGCQSAQRGATGATERVQRRRVD